MRDLITAVGDVVCRNIPGDQRTGADVGASTDVDIANDHGTPADKGTVRHHRGRLIRSRIVPRNARVELAMNKLARDPATLANLAIVADITLDHTIVGDLGSEADLGPADHEDTFSHDRFGLDPDLVLDDRASANHGSLADHCV